MKQSKIRILCQCAILLALATVLSYIRIIPLPFGGAVTLFSMLPICLVSIRFGIGWGLGTAFCFSWLQILQGDVFAWGLTPKMLVASLLLDYIVAFTVLGLSGILRRRGVSGMILGTVIACVLRFAVHFYAGVVLWANYEEFMAFGTSWINRPYLYSFLYNGTYMLPETVMTVIAIFLLFRIPQFKKWFAE